MRVFNFSAGPAALPLEVLEQARDELIDWQGGGMSVMEISHRSKAFIAVAQQAEADLRELLSVPANYRVLFLQGGATGQFSAIPMNLATQESVVDYVNTGSWSKKALGDARRFCNVNVVADAADSGYNTIPAVSGWKRTPGAAYLHYTPNETIGGVEFHFVPEIGATPLVADMSSTLLSRPIEVSKFGLIYAGAQKNMGPSGLTLVIVRDDLIGHARPGTPLVFDYKEWPMRAPCSTRPRPSAGISPAWYSSGSSARAVSRPWRNSIGPSPQSFTPQSMAQRFTATRWPSDCRSWMNVPFTLARPELDKQFIAEARTVGLTNLEGHRSVGGMRARASTTPCRWRE